MRINRASDFFLGGGLLSKNIFSLTLRATLFLINGSTLGTYVLHNGSILEYRLSISTS